MALWEGNELKTMGNDVATPRTGLFLSNDAREEDVVERVLDKADDTEPTEDFKDLGVPYEEEGLRLGHFFDKA